MAKILMRVEGYDGQVELMTDRVVIRREGLLNAMWYGFNSKREIPLAAISEVMFKDAGALKQGEIEFIRAGQAADKKNANRVKFPKKKNPEFEAFKEKVFHQLNTLARQTQNKP